jgi:hypothetical protein
MVVNPPQLILNLIGGGKICAIKIIQLNNSIFFIPARADLIRPH